jgi:serine/threonine protein kinase
MGTSFQLGDIVGHYRLDSLVATSAMATLFRATDTRSGSPVAVKVRRSDCPLSRLFSIAIADEARISAKLNHPGIVRVLSDSQTCRDYTVMEWADGRSLRQIIEERGRLPIEQCIEVALNLCEVVEYIHGKGIVHLDLKPENVIVLPDDTIKLIDFGLAREVKRGFSSLLAPKAKGTPDYASPEQIRGKSPDARSDIYSLGLMLYEMLTGEVPFSGAAMGTALQLRAFSDPLSLDEIDPDIAPELCQVVLRSLARDPSKRTPSALEFTAQLQQTRNAAICEFA